MKVTKEQYLRYRERATEMARQGIPLELTVSPNAPVQPTEDGAYVEVQMWVSKEEA
jgi:hypothetical protein